MKVSARFRDAFKLATAIVIVYAISLSQGWGTPYWAGFAVVSCGLSELGSSLNKGILRVFGTLFGAMVGLAILAIFPQDRWLFIILMNLFIALCTYMMGGTTRWYFWFMAGITVPIVAITAEPDAVYDFNRAVLRTQQTTVGIVVYSFVSLLIWPVSSRGVFEGAVGTLIDQQRLLLSGYLSRFAGNPEDTRTAQLRASVRRALGSLQELLDHAEIDTSEIWDKRHAWRRVISQLQAIDTTMEGWRLGFAELAQVDTSSAILQLPAMAQELEARFTAVKQMSAGKNGEYRLNEEVCTLDQENIATYTRLEQSALELAVAHLNQLENQSRKLFETISSIKGLTRADEHEPEPAIARSGAWFDPDRLLGVVRVSGVLWITMLLYFYVPDLPMASFIAILSTVLTMLMSLLPQINPLKALFMPGAFGTMLGALVHIFIMPHLPGFFALGIMLFGSVFGLVYLLYSPKYLIFRFVGIAFLLVLASINTPQHYSFMGVANLSLVFPIILLVLTISRYFPVSYRAEHRFQATLRRFFNSCEFLVGSGPPPRRRHSFPHRLRTAHHLHEVATAPGKLAGLAHSLVPAALGTTTREEVQSMVASVEALGRRTMTLVEVRARSRPENVINELRREVDDWLINVEQTFASLAQEPEGNTQHDLRTRLDAKLDRIEKAAEAQFDSFHHHPPSSAEAKDIGRLLGAHRGLSEALVAFAGAAPAIDWVRLREPRF